MMEEKKEETVSIVQFHFGDEVLTLQEEHYQVHNNNEPVDKNSISSSNTSLNISPSNTSLNNSSVVSFQSSLPGSSYTFDSDTVVLIESKSNHTECDMNQSIKHQCDRNESNKEEKVYQSYHSSSNSDVVIAIAPDPIEPQKQRINVKEWLCSGSILIRPFKCFLLILCFLPASLHYCCGSCVSDCFYPCWNGIVSIGSACVNFLNECTCASIWNCMKAITDCLYNTIVLCCSNFYDGLSFCCTNICDAVLFMCNGLVVVLEAIAKGVFKICKFSYKVIEIIFRAIGLCLSISFNYFVKCLNFIGNIVSTICKTVYGLLEQCFQYLYREISSLLQQVWQIVFQCFSCLCNRMFSCLRNIAKFIYTYLLQPIWNKIKSQG